MLYHRIVYLQRYANANASEMLEMSKADDRRKISNIYSHTRTRCSYITITRITWFRFMENGKYNYNYIISSTGSVLHMCTLKCSKNIT